MTKEQRESADFFTYLQGAAEPERTFSNVTDHRSWSVPVCLMGPDGKGRQKGFWLLKCPGFTAIAALPISGGGTSGPRRKPRG